MIRKAVNLRKTHWVTAGLSVELLNKVIKQVDGRGWDFTITLLKTPTIHKIVKRRA